MSDQEKGDRPERSRFTRKAERGSYDVSRVEALLDAVLVCQVGFLRGDSVCVLTLMHARIGRAVYLHGAARGQLMQQLCSQQICLSTTQLDGIVFGRSQLHHSLNYRSICVFGRPHCVEDEQEKRSALSQLIERTAPGRSTQSRPPTSAELRATGVARLNLQEATFKQRTGPPVDTASDETLPYWAGELPITQAYGEPRTAVGVEVPVPKGILGLL